MNFFDTPGDGDEEVFEDKPEEMDGKYDERTGAWIAKSAPPAEVKVMAAPKAAAVAPVVEPEEEAEEAVEEEDASDILIDARLRLEMGKLYELIMKHDLFAGVDADPKAIKVVQKEIRAYAQERMEIMLGMRQEKQEAQNSFPMEQFPFNSLEVEVLKALAATATKGESRDASPLDLGAQRPPPRTTLNPIGKNTAKTTAVTPKLAVKKPLASRPQTPVKRAEANAKIQRILEEEGLTMDEINEVFDPNREPLDRKKLAKMKEDEIVALNKAISLRNKRAENPNATPMPTPDQMAAQYTQRSLNAEAQKPGWRQLIDMVKVMPPTIANNDQNE